MARSDVGSVCLPIPPLTHISALKSHVSEKHGLTVGWMGSFENVFLVLLFFIQYFKFSVAFFIGNLVDLSVWHPFCCKQ